MFMSALQAMSHMSAGRAASFADLKGSYDMMQHYLKAVTIPAPAKPKAVMRHIMGHRSAAHVIPTCLSSALSIVHCMYSA